MASLGLQVNMAQLRVVGFMNGILVLFLQGFLLIGAEMAVVHFLLIIRCLVDRDLKPMVKVVDMGKTVQPAQLDPLAEMEVRVQPASHLQLSVKRYQVVMVVQVVQVVPRELVSPLMVAP
jgi:hypothetical protein